MFISPAWAQAAGSEAGGALTAFLPLILIFAIFYFLLIRPQQKKQKQHQAKLEAVRRGDKIITGGGVFGTVTKVLDDNEIQVEIAEGVKVRVAKAMIADVLSKTEPVSGGKPANDGGEKKGLLGGLLGGGQKSDDAGEAKKAAGKKPDAKKDDGGKADK